MVNGILAIGVTIRWEIVVLDQSVDPHAKVMQLQSPFQDRWD